MTVAPSGMQHEIVYREQRATIVEVGGGVRAYSDGGRDVLHPYDVEAMCDGAHGAPLIPWPNRLEDGRYTFDGEEYSVSLTEPEKSNAIHGFLRWRNWQLVERTENSVTMGVRLYPLKGYPFTLDLRVVYTLGDDGLTVRTTATNAGGSACPYAHGQHPYLSPGSGRIDDCELQVTAQTRIDTDPQRQLPTGTEAVAGTEYDFREPRRLDDLAIDFAFRDLVRDDSGHAWIRLLGADGRTAGLWVDESFEVLEVYTADTLAPERQRRGLGAEPMTGPPNCFVSGDGVIRLEPGASATTTWGCRLEG